MKASTTPALLLALLLGSLNAQDHKELGRMWTFENAPLDWIEKEYGFRPDKKWLDHARMASLRFHQGCSASFVSPRGLIMTNHHCARGEVAKASPPDQDWLKDGFFAKSNADEVKLKGVTVQQLIAMTDVTAEMNKGLDGVDDPKERQDLFNRNQRLVKGKAKEQYPGSSKLELVTLYQGGMYQLYVYKIFRDVRLVAAPSLQAAKFGGDPDNFTYPRFSLDYTFCRAYENDKPADTSKHYFKWRTEGPKEGDAAFVTGNPGSTGRLDTVAQMEFMRDALYPSQLKRIHQLIQQAQDIIASDPSRAKSMRSRILSLENARKAFTGYLDGLRKKRVMDTKRAAEKRIRAAVDANPELAKKYGHAWTRLAELSKQKVEALKKGMRSGEYRAIEKAEGPLKKLIGEAHFAVYGTKIPPDATFTLRLSDGKVKGFPMNGTIAPFFTSLYGLYARHTEFGGKEPFDLPERWVKLASKLDLTTPFNLVSTCDIIGGNSGSPMVNKDLEVIGLVFDGNIESLSNRFVFMDDVPRTVCVHPAIIILSLRKIYGLNKLADEIEGKSRRNR